MRVQVEGSGLRALAFRVISCCRDSCRVYFQGFIAVQRALGSLCGLLGCLECFIGFGYKMALETVHILEA